jgi:hypothetical protein
VDVRIGKVRQAASVVEVEVRGNDLAHVLWLEAERADLRDSRLGLARLQGERDVVDPPELARVAHVVEPEAGIDQDEPIGTLDEQTVTDQPRRPE